MNGGVPSTPLRSLATTLQLVPKFHLLICKWWCYTFSSSSLRLQNTMNSLKAMFLSSCQSSHTTTLLRLIASCDSILMKSMPMVQPWWSKFVNINYLGYQFQVQLEFNYKCMYNPQNNWFKWVCNSWDCPWAINYALEED